MANHVSALKRARQTEVKTERNRASKSRLRGALRAVRETLEGSDKAAAEKELRLAVSSIDKAVQKGSLHKNTAARYKSRLSARLAKISSK
jgi:small subunit ribosomal protein S20